MADTPNTESNTNANNIMDMLRNFDPNTLNDEDRLEWDRKMMSNVADIDSDRRSLVNALERAEKVAELNVIAEAVGLFKASDRFYGKTNNNIWLRLTIVRHRDPKTNEWVYQLGGIPSAAKGDVFLPGGKDLKLRYKGETFLNTVDATGKTVDKPRGAKHAALALCKAINLDVGKDNDGKTSSPGTSRRRQLELLDGDGNPAGKSTKRTELEQCEIQHPTINDGKWMKLTDFYLEWSNPDEEDEEPTTEAEATS